MIKNEQLNNEDLHETLKKLEHQILPILDGFDALNIIAIMTTLAASISVKTLISACLDGIISKKDARLAYEGCMKHQMKRIDKFLKEIDFEALKQEKD